MAEQYDLEWYLERLEGVEGSNGSYIAWCPVHDDVGTSHKGLSITAVGKRLLMKCHSPQCGAQLPEVTAALNGEVPEDFAVNVRKKSTPKKKETPAKNGESGGMAWWVAKTEVDEEVWAHLGCIEHENGVAFIFEDAQVAKVRKPEKEIYWEPKFADTPPLWPYPDDDLPEHVSITEGESDCGTAHAAGLPFAFSITKGASTHLPTEAFEALARRGVHEVTIFGDADTAGKEFQTNAARAATDANLVVNVVDLTRKVDPFSGITDLNGVWRACETEEQFTEIIEACTYRVEAHRSTSTDEHFRVAATSEIEWLIPDLIAPGDKGLISGPQKSYKTWLMLDLARCLVTGQPFLMRNEWKHADPRRVLVVEEEGSFQAFAKRYLRLGFKSGEGERFHALHRQGIRFTDEDTITEVIATCRSLNIDVVFFDPLQRMIPGVNENDSAETGVVWDQVQRMQQVLPHLAVIITHHANKMERLTWESVRGSSRHAGEVDFGIMVEKHPLERNVIRVSVDGRDIVAELGAGEAFEAEIEITEETFRMDARDVTVQVRKTSKTVFEKNEEAVLEAIKEGHNTRKKVEDHTGLSEGTVRKYIAAFVSAEIVEEQDTGKGKVKFYTYKGE